MIKQRHTVKDGGYNFGKAPLSMILVFIVMSVCAVIMAFQQSRPEWPMPLKDLILINEGLALLATLVYGIILHLAIAEACLRKVRIQISSYEP